LERSIAASAREVRGRRFAPTVWLDVYALREVFVVGRGTIRMRWMTLREYARLQGCPNFPINVERNDALFGFGDAVCVPVIDWIAQNVLSQLFPVVTRQLQQAAGD
jgi:site-specific DNA-cytosine methylase